MGFLTDSKIKSIKKKLVLLLKKRQEGEEVSDADREKEVQLHRYLGQLYDKVRYNKKYPHAEVLALESYRNAASLSNPDALYIVGQRLLERGKFWDLMRRGVFGNQIHEKYSNGAYEEAFTYLKAAEEEGHIMAKRLHGLSYINGWGMKKDMDQGFKLVIASIQQEGAWDRATKIFEELGLNKPEFFSYVMTSRKQD